MMYGNFPTKEPDLEGLGRAWRIPALDPPERPDHKASIARWLVHAPHGHPTWPWYVVSCVHLRPIDGVGPATIHFHGATHEITFFALNPEVPLPDLDNWRRMAFLTPVDLVHQLIVQDDDQASELTDLIVRHILDGASPDQDYRQYWKSVVNKTSEHMRLGGHPE